MVYLPPIIHIRTHAHVLNLSLRVFSLHFLAEVSACDLRPGHHNMVNVTSSSPFLDYNENDHTALVVIVTIFFCLLMLMSVIAKLFLRLSIGASLQDHDFIQYLAALLMLVQTICIVSASDPGIGKHEADVLSDLEKIQKVNRQDIRTIL